MPNDVVIASGTEASVGKPREKEGGSRYQASTAEALEPNDVRMWELDSHQLAAVTQACFCIPIVFLLPPPTHARTASFYSSLYGFDGIK